MAGRFDISRRLARGRLASAAMAMLVASGVAVREADAQDLLRPGRDEPWARQHDPLGSIDLSTPPFSREQLRGVTVDPEVLETVARLDSADYAQREAASDALKQREDWRIQMYALLAGDSITTEQRCRLLQVVRDQLVNMPRGALGVEMAPLLPMRGEALEIRIVDLIAGLPAERVLQVGDRIIAIDKQPLFIEDDLQSRVQAKRPGETVSVMVKRSRVDDNGRVVRDDKGEPRTDVLEFDIALGSADVLDRQSRNLRTASNRVMTARRIEADAITYAFAPQPQLVAVSGGMPLASEANPIDEHPAIANLLVQQDMLSGRNPEQVRMMRDMWRRQLADLVELANHPGMSADERARMREVAQRFAELINVEP